MTAFDWPYEWGKFKERTLMSLAWHMPRKIVYWCAIRLMAHATTGRWGNQVVPELRITEALERWDKR